MAAAGPAGAGDLPRLAEDLLGQLQDNFQALAERIALRMEEMGERLEGLELHVAQLMAEAGIDKPQEELRVRTFLPLGLGTVGSTWQEDAADTSFVPVLAGVLKHTKVTQTWHWDM
ncbi:heat shock factor-binding protein 1-like protein 1 [Dryobates pubescens]|uniref:heat shock factor-binding protein 1-like protein 1 n=1 Tax=Dryobates pubescens TaxID=118200 RepID=UPI0023B95A5D|nr:heat shock factor-binding protein 1-like protein 1 [Dryobates pubescens]